MVNPEAIDEARTAAFLAKRYGDAVSSVAHLGTGAWSKAFAFRLRQDGTDTDLVIRFGALREDFDKDRLAARFATLELPIPRVLEVGAADAIDPAAQRVGGYYAISQRLYGEYIDGVDAAQMRALLPSLFAALDAMRLADVSHTAGYGIWDGSGIAPYMSWSEVLLDAASDRPSQRTHGWSSRLASSATGREPFDQAYRQLVSIADTLPETRHLIHSDLLHFNVLVTGSQVTGVLDWGCGLYGDFLYDLAWLCFWAPWYTAWAGIDFQAEATRHYASIGLNVPRFEARLQACQLHIGLTSQSYQAYIGDWNNLAWTARRTLEIAQ
ncbi:MAG: phosphotransferase family protein [Chloroflexota bacterium]